jgi:enoyl-CoA hydratase/carnithine racemase
LATALKSAWERFEADPGARVAILSGAGKAFSAGRDISEGAVDDSVPFQTHQAHPENGAKIFKPIIGAIHGYTLGWGFVSGVRSCDITIAGESTLLGFPEARAGIALNPFEYVPYLPFKVSLEFALLAWRGGKLMDAHRAYQLGLVNEVVPDDELQATALKWAELLKKIPPLYIRSVKYGHYRSVETDAHRREREYIDYVWPQEMSADLEEARVAFRERRDPNFSRS